MGILAGYMYHIYREGIFGAVSCTVRILIPIVLLFLLFLIRALGAGDVKLFSAIACMAEQSIFIYTFIFSFLLGAGYALMKLLIHRNLVTSLLRFFRYLKEIAVTKKCAPYRKEMVWDKQTMHFSVAILGGFLISLGVMS